MDPALAIRETAADQAADSVDVVVDSDVFELTHRHGAPVDLVPGLLISDNIRLVALLGVGGMGSVWLADHTGLETRVAVKFMSEDLAHDPACVARFAAEAKLAARLKSPHVVNILDYATTAEGVPYIVMELLEGEDLDARIRGGQRLGLEDSSRVLVQICKALANAHELGIVHRDIKPENVFVTQHDGEMFVKVLDFGIAKDEGQAQSLTMSGTTMGTPSYMSPEQLFCPKSVDLRSDLWSTAVVAYRCLTGQLPFEGDTFGTMCLSVNGDAFAPPRSIDPSLPRELDAWFFKALSLDPNARFQSANEMADAYLTVLARARLLPRWAAPRETTGDRPSYTSDPGGISGGPIVLRRSRGGHLRALVLGLLVLAFFSLAAVPRESIVATVDGWRARYTPELNPAADEPPLVFEEPNPPWPGPRPSPALAQRDEARPQIARPTASVRKILPLRIDDDVATPASSSDDPGAPGEHPKGWKSLTREKPSPQNPGAQFGI